MTAAFGQLEKIDDYRWRIPKNYKPGMRVDGVIYASEEMLPPSRPGRKRGRRS